MIEPTVVLGSTVGSIIVVLVTTAVGPTLEAGAGRYSFPILLAALLALLCAAAGGAEPPGRRRTVALAVIAVLLCGFFWLDTLELYGRRTRRIASGFRTQQPLPLERFRTMQSAVPAGEPILVRLDLPFLLDFERNPIYVVDHPTMVGPPPGMPAFQGGEALADYLVDQGIRYVAYAYRNQAHYARQDHRYRLAPDEHPVRRALAAHVFDFNDSLRELGRKRHRIHDDGEAFVLDLRRSRARR